MSTTYVAIFVLSILLPVGYDQFVRRTREEPWLLALDLSGGVVDLGDLILARARTVEMALLANKIAYLGQAFVPLCMFMLVSGLCGVRHPKWVKYLLVCLAAAMFGLVLTTGHLDWYYKSVELTFVGKTAVLVKEYGVLHPVNLFYVLGYFVAMLTVAFVSMKRHRERSFKLVGLVLAIVVCNIGGWIVQKLVSWNFEFLAVSYLMSEVIFFFLFWMMGDYVLIRDLPWHVVVEPVTAEPAVTEPAAAEEKAPIIVVDNLTQAEKLRAILASLPEGTTLTPRQIEILARILDGKSRKEIAAEMYLSENTVKTHTSALYKALGVSSREEILTLIQK